MPLSQRCTLVLLLIVLAVPLIGVEALVSFEEEQRAEESLMDALSSAVERYRTFAVPSSTEVRERLVQIESTLQEITREKNAVRKSLASLRAAKQELFEHGVDPDNAETFTRSVSEGEEVLRGIVRLLSRAQGGMVGPGNALWKGIAPFLSAMFLWQDAQADLSALEERHRVLQGEYIALLKNAERARGVLAWGEEGKVQAQEILAEVHERVMELQRARERIDARLKERAERDLIAKGLWSSGERIAMGGGAHLGAPVLSWPVYGPVSAGYLDASYEERFGIPHEGVDIEVSQGSPVYAAADGVVFAVRDGGEKGYTYMLIGHRDGFATLYGHLSSVVKSAGEEVAAGEFIGLSGGEIGAPGSGPLTTGPHLHFEVIERGVHIDPLEFLL